MNSVRNNKKYFKFFLFFPIMLLGLSVLGFVVMKLWNWLMPFLFNLPELSFWQALGLFALSKLLFGSFHFNGRNRKMHYNKMALKQKMMSMSDEERQLFKEQWKHRCQ